MHIFQLVLIFQLLFVCHLRTDNLLLCVFFFFKPFKIFLYSSFKKVPNHTRPNRGQQVPWCLHVAQTAVPLTWTQNGLSDVWAPLLSSAGRPKSPLKHSSTVINVHYGSEINFRENILTEFAQAIKTPFAMCLNIFMLQVFCKSDRWLISFAPEATLELWWTKIDCCYDPHLQTIHHFQNSVFCRS